MPELRVNNFTISLDGFACGPGQSEEAPFGAGGERLHEWTFNTRGAREMMGMEGGETGLDDRTWRRGFENLGASIMGRNMFGPIRGDWGTTEWQGWWGPNPPYRHPVFILTNHPRPSIEMEGGTTFHFITDGIEAALDAAFEAAGDKDVQVAGGASTIRQYLRAGLVDEMHVVIAPILLGGGERLFEGLEPDGYTCVELAGSDAVVHTRFRRAKD